MLDGILSEPLIQLVIFVATSVIFMYATCWMLDRVWITLGGDDK